MSRQTLYSFDVFDTVVTRTYATPEDLIADLGERLQCSGIIADSGSFFALRCLAEREAWAQSRFRRAISIDVIYELLAVRYGWTKALAERAMEIEVALEKASARAVPSIVAMINRHRLEGGSICFVSDMHLRASHIRDILETLGVCHDGDQVYVSSEWRVTKVQRGALFRRLLRQHRLPGWCVQHIGDNRRADVVMPRLHLMRGTHFTAACMTRAEQLLLGRVSPTDPGLRKIVVASKFARLRTCSTLRDIPAVLFDAVAPFVCGYALWLIQQARRDGVSKLFFLARDMQIVCEVTRQLAKQLGADVECVYLHASRAAWQPVVFDGQGDLFWLTDQLHRRTPRQALLRILAADEIDALERHGSWVSDLQDPDLDESMRKLVNEPRCRSAIGAAVKRRRQLLLDYVAQHGFDPADGCALVDAGWRGSLQRALWRAFAASGQAASIRGYYIGLRHAGPANEACSMRPYLDSALVKTLGYSLVTLTEAFLAADHGTTLAYERNSEGIVTPVIAQPPPDATRFQVAAMRWACETYGEELANCINVADRLQTLPELLSEPFTRLCADPSTDEAVALRRWLLDVGREQARLVPIASAANLRDVVKIFYGAIRREPEADLYLSGPWVRGSLALTNPLLRKLLQSVLPALRNTVK